MPKNKGDIHSIINLRRLAEAAGVDYYKLYHNITGRYSNENGKALGANERIELTNALHSELSKLSDFLDIDIIVRRRAR